MGTPTICDRCGAELPFNAKVCLVCGKKRKKPFYKSALFWFLSVFAVLMVGVGLAVSNDAALPAPSSLLAKEMGLSQEQEEAALDVFAQCGIGEIVSVEIFHEGETESSYYVEDSETKAYRGADYTIVVWLGNGSKEVRSIYFHDQDIYVDGEVKAKVSDLYVNKEDRDKYRVAAQMLVNELLLVPDSADYPSQSGWAFGLEDGVVIVRSSVKSKNAFNVVLESKFQIKFQDGDPISLILDGKEYIK